MKRILLLTASVLALAATAQFAHAQSIGTQDNFDCFNDTGTEAEGFEMDLDNIQPSDLTRTFGASYIRYGDPTVSAYDHTATGGSTGVAIVWAAHWNGAGWQTANPLLGAGTPYIAKPTLTAGESCWTFGLAANYPASGCEHFGISLTATAAPTKAVYHWLVPDPTHPGTLIQNAAPAALPASPSYTYYGAGVVGAAPVVNVVAEAPEKPEMAAQWSDAYWVKIYTSHSPARANLNDLQTGHVPVKSAGVTKVTFKWAFVQRAPVGQVGEVMEVENEPVRKGDAAITKRFEYYKFAGLYSAESHEANCADRRCTAPQKIGLNGVKELGFW